ncbi:hypothetical protein [Dactylosporangium sp. NPDC005555]|uniref:hypothetical protein n=1 Tax=Dactylosporangium sp. NPDC005555 TaxID=3154889 RepID=UPI0033B3FC56
MPRAVQAIDAARFAGIAVRGDIHDVLGAATGGSSVKGGLGNTHACRAAPLPTRSGNRRTATLVRVPP